MTPYFHNITPGFKTLAHFTDDRALKFQDILNRAKKRRKTEKKTEWNVENKNESLIFQKKLW